MADKNNNLNALLARLKNNNANKERNKSPELTNIEQSAFNNDNNISNLLKQSKLGDDSDFKYPQLDENKQIFKPYTNNDVNFEREEEFNNFQPNERYADSKPIFPNNDDVVVNNSIFLNNQSETNFNNKISLGAGNQNARVENNSKPQYNMDNKKSNNFEQKIEDEFDVEEIVDLNDEEYNNNKDPQIKYSYRGNQEKGTKQNNNFFQKTNDISDIMSPKNEKNDFHSQNQNKENFPVNNSILDNNENKSIPSHIDAFNNLKNMQNIGNRESFANIQKDLEKKSLAKNNNNIPDDLYDKKKQIANEYQSKMKKYDNNQENPSYSKNNNNFFSQNNFQSEEHNGKF